MKTLSTFFCLLALCAKDESPTLIHSANAFENEAPEWASPLVEESIPEADPETLASELGFTLPAEKTSALPSLDKAMSAKVRVMTFRRPLDFDYEFTLLVVGGKIKRAFIVSTSMPGKAAILGIHRLSAPVLDTMPHKPFPWRTSKSYFDSPMYWALNINDGYFIHSSPHYGNLGHPASMGCIRESIPDAMEVFNTVVNQFAGSPSYSIIFDQLKLGSGSDGEKALLKTLVASEWTIDQLKAALKQSKMEVALVSRGDLEYAPGVPVDAHVRPFEDTPQLESSFPTCGGVDCWDLFHKKRTTLKLRPYIAFKNPPKDEYHSDQLIALATAEMIAHSPAPSPSVIPAPLPTATPAVTPAMDAPVVVPPVALNPLPPVVLTQLLPAVSSLNLNMVLSGSIKLLDPRDLFEVSVNLSGQENALTVRICDSVARVCSKPRGPEASSTGEFVFPMHEVGSNLKSTTHLILQVVSGSGTLNLMKVSYYH